MKKSIFLIISALLFFSCAEEKITSIEMTEVTCEIVSGGTHILTYKYSPQNYDRPVVKWTSSDSEIVKIIETSNVTCKIKGVRVGSAVITCTELSTGKNLSTQCRVNVLSAAKFNTELIAIEKGETVYLPNYISGTSSYIEWKSSNTTICTIENNILYAHEVGKCSISGHVQDDNIDLVCDVEVLPIQPTEIRCDSYMEVVYDEENDNNNYYEIVYTLYPEGAQSEVNVTSDNPTVVEVVANHHIHVKQLGSAILTLKTSNGLRATINISVYEDTPVVYASMYQAGDVIINGVTFPGKIYITITNYSYDYIELLGYVVYSSTSWPLIRHSYEEGQLPYVGSYQTYEIASFEKSSEYVNSQCFIDYRYKGKTYVVKAQW